MRGEGKMYDVVIIGAGVCGAAIARECSKYHLKIAVLEKEEDVCCGTSKANSGIVHAGYDAKENTLMAKLNVEGNKMMTKLSEDLQIPFIRNGSIVACTSESQLQDLEMLYQRGIKNHVEDLELIRDKERIFMIEPNLSDEVIAILYAKTAGIVCPFELNLAMAENAKDNGVDFYFNHEVVEIKKEKQFYNIKTSTEEFLCKIVINAAGVYADKIHNFVSKEKIKIIPRKGEYFLLDKVVGNHLKHTVFALPGKLGKGVLVTPSVHGNILVGPTATDIDNKEDVSTTIQGIQEIKSKAGLQVKNLPLNLCITSFSGLRANSNHHDFIIEEVIDAPNFIDCAGIKSPGLSAAPAIGKYVSELVVKLLQPKLKENFIAKRKSIVHFKDLDYEEKQLLLKEKPLYGQIICRCEMISEQEIRECIHTSIGATTFDGIKRRTRAMMGRCQGGFCSIKILDILKDELKCSKDKVKKSGKNSFVLAQNHEGECYEDN